MSSNPLDAYKELDPKLIEQYEKLQGLALSAKFKLLIAMAMSEKICLGIIAKFVEEKSLKKTTKTTRACAGNAGTTS